MKKIIALLLSIIMMLTFVACSSSGDSSDNGGAKAEETTAAPTVEELAEEAVDAEFSKITNADSVELFEELMNSEESYDYSDAEKEALEKVVDALAEPFEYNIISSEKIDDETVEVTLTITSVNGTVAAEKFFEEFIPYGMQMAFADPAPTEEEMSIAGMEFLVDALKNAGTIVTKKDVEVVLVDGEWVIDADDMDFADILCDNFSNRVNELSEEMENSF